jgi:hypothetical protein
VIGSVQVLVEHAACRIPTREQCEELVEALASSAATRTLFKLAFCRLVEINTYYQLEAVDALRHSSRICPRLKASGCKVSTGVESQAPLPWNS